MDMNNIVKDVIAVDKYTVKITLKKKEAPFIANLAMEFAMILSSDYADQLAKADKKNDLGKRPVGTGPFVFKKWTKDDKITYTANKNYWNGRPYVDKLIFKVITNNSVRAAELKAGSIHIMDFPNPAESVVAERPLRSYSLDVHELEERPGVFQITAEFRPHVSIVGMDINLKLVAYHSGEES